MSDEVLKGMGFEPVENLEEENVIEESLEEGVDAEEPEESEDDEGDDEAQDEPEDVEGDAEEELSDDDLLEQAEKNNVAPELTKALRRNLDKTKAQAVENERIRADNEQSKAQIDAILEKLQEKQAPVSTEEVPDKEYEPEQYAAYKADQNAKELADLKQQQALQQSISTAETYLSTHESSTQNADYQSAKAFALNQVRQNIRAGNPYMTAAQIEAQVRYAVAEESAGAMQRGENPADLVYKYAVDNGFAAKTSAPKVNIANINKNSAKSSSLGDTSGGSPRSTLTTADLTKMSPEEMGAFKTKNPAAFADIMTQGYTNVTIKRSRR